MSWLSANSFFLLILLLCVGMHLFHGHGGHGGHGDDDDDSPSSDHRHH